jgi:hypothetical protein
MAASRRPKASPPTPPTPDRHPLWPPVRASVDKDERTVIFTTGEPDDLDGAMATCASAAEAVALAQFVNRQGCPASVPMAAPDRRRASRA